MPPSLLDSGKVLQGSRKDLSLLQELLQPLTVFLSLSSLKSCPRSVDNDTPTLLWLLGWLEVSFQQHKAAATGSRGGVTWGVKDQL